jgi:hypothetical protein
LHSTALLREHEYSRQVDLESFAAEVAQFHPNEYGVISRLSGEPSSF